MKRFAYVAVLMAGACTSGVGTGTGTVSGITPVPMSATATAFEGTDAGGTKVLGWKIEFFEEKPGEDCLSAELNVLAKIGIYTKTAVGSAPQALLQTGSISITTESPPTVLAEAAAVMTAEGLGDIHGAVNIETFHLTPDAKHADRIVGTITAGAASSSGPVEITGMFDTAVCVEE